MVRKRLFRIFQKLRFSVYLKLLDKSAKTLIDVGSGDSDFVERVNNLGMSAVGTDIEEDVQTMSREADIITCFEVLEHVHDPVKALKNLSRLYRRQLIISVPNEPTFSLLRLGWDPEHLWGISPALLRFYLGEPVFEKTIILNRYYVGVWLKK